MDSVQRRRESQFSIPMEQQLTRAVELRIEAEEEFKKQIVFSLKDLIQKLAECDPSNARTTLDLTQDQLRKIIIKLNDKRNISSTEAQTIANVVKENNLFRGPTLPQSPPPSALPTPPVSLQSPPPSALPITPSAPSPFLPGPNSLSLNPPSTPARNLPPGRRPTGPGGRRTRRKGKTRR